jgi:Na+/H+ antiporter NhaD/arsenite permease-like protein
MLSGFSGIYGLDVIFLVIVLWITWLIRRARHPTIGTVLCFLTFLFSAQLAFVHPKFIVCAVALICFICSVLCIKFSFRKTPTNRLRR